MQPTYVPWVGYFDLMDSVDMFVYYDNVQMKHRYWDVRNRIKTAQGELYLTVPVSKKIHRDNRTFCNAEVNYNGLWCDKHIKSIKNNYKKTAFFEDVVSMLAACFKKKPKYLADLNIEIIDSIKSSLGITTKTVRASSLLNVPGKKDEKLVNMCKSLLMEDYLSPIGARDYINEISLGGEFVRQGLNLFYQNYKHPVYEQGYGDFLSHMSIVDLLCNYGFNDSLEIIRSGRKKRISYDDSY